MLEATATLKQEGSEELRVQDDVSTSRDHMLQSLESSVRCLSQFKLMWERQETKLHGLQWKHEKALLQRKTNGKGKDGSNSCTVC